MRFGTKPFKSPQHKTFEKPFIPTEVKKLRSPQQKQLSNSKSTQFGFFKTPNHISLKKGSSNETAGVTPKPRSLIQKTLPKS